MRLLKLWVIFVLFCTPLLSQAAEIKLTSSTQYLWYQDILAWDKEKTQQDVAEYLRLNITKLDKEGNVNIYAYGRANKQVSTGDDPQGRLYYFFLDYRDLIKDHLDLRAGRTYVHAAAISGTVDGIHADVKNLGPFGITLFGGRHVIFEDRKETGTRGEGLAGGSIYLDTIKNTHIEVSYGRKYVDTEVARENVGLDFSTTPVGRVNLYGRLKYDIMSETYNEGLFGAKIPLFKDLVLRGEFYRSYPTFDVASIYTVFAVDKYTEKSLTAEYQLSKDYRLSFKYGREEFGDNADANVYEVGLRARPVKDLVINASYEKRDGYAGDLSGLRIYGEYKISRAAIMAGIDYDDFKRELSREGTAKKYWAGMTYEFNKIVSCLVRIEDNINFNYDRSYQGYAAININY